MNQAIFKRIYVVNDEVTDSEIASPIAEMIDADRLYSVKTKETTGEGGPVSDKVAAWLKAIDPDDVSSKDYMVDLTLTYYKHFQSLCQLLRSLESDTPPLRAAPRGAAPKRLQRLSDEAIPELCRLYRDGASTYELARVFGIRRDQAAILPRRAGVEVRPGHQAKLSEKDKMVARELRGEGLSIRKIAVRLGVSDNTVPKGS